MSTDGSQPVRPLAGPGDPGNVREADLCSRGPAVCWDAQQMRKRAYKHRCLVKGICGYDLGKASELEGVVRDPTDFGDPSQAAWGLSVLQS